MLKLTISTLFICLLTFNVAIAQDKTFSKYIENGIALHDEGQYLEAIKQYEKALKINKKSTLVHAEIAYSYVELGDSKAALRHVNKAFKGDASDKYPMIYVMKGNVLDDLGKFKQAVKAYKQGIAKYPDMAMLYFNLGITYMRANQENNAKNTIITAISKNYSHASSHYYLGKMMEKQGRKIPAIMSYYFFLMLEPETIRADEIYDKLLDLLIRNDNVNKTAANEFEININANDLSDLEFAPLELVLSLDITEMLKQEDEVAAEKPKTDTDKLISKTELLFSMLQEEEDDKQGIWWDFYAPYYAHIADCEVITAFCHHIGLSKGGDIALWMEAHEEEAIDFVNCVNEYGQ